MNRKKSFLDAKSKKARKKTLEELQKRNIEIQDEDKISGGFVEYSRWLEVPSREEPNRPPDTGTFD